MASTIEVDSVRLRPSERISKDLEQAQVPHRNAEGSGGLKVSGSAEVLALKGLTDEEELVLLGVL